MVESRWESKQGEGLQWCMVEVEGRGTDSAWMLLVMDSMVTVAWATTAHIHFSAPQWKVNDNLESSNPEESRRP